MTLQKTLASKKCQKSFQILKLKPTVTSFRSETSLLSLKRLLNNELRRDQELKNQDSISMDVEGMGVLVSVVVVVEVVEVVEVEDEAEVVDVVRDGKSSAYFMATDGVRSCVTTYYVVYDLCWS